MSLENIINKVKESGKKTFRNIALLTGISLASLIGCENKPMINPLAPSINSDIYGISGLKFSGDAYEVKFKPTEQPYQTYETRSKTPNGQWSEWKETEQDENSFYVVSSTFTDEFGRYESQGRAISGDRATESQSSNGDYHMNEAQSDVALQTIIAPLVKPGSTTDGDIIDAKFNQNVFFGQVYNNDAYITIHDSTVGGNQRSYALDVSGSINDIYDSQKHTNATATGTSYNNIGAFSLTASLEAKVNELQSAGWQRTDQ